MTAGRSRPAVSASTSYSKQTMTQSPVAILKLRLMESLLFALQIAENNLCVFGIAESYLLSVKSKIHH